MNGPCAKQRVVATLIARDGLRFVGENDCENPQTECPRAGLATGEGYHLCRSICHQTAHAEINAIAAATGHTDGATLYIEGHYYACDACRLACDAAGIAEIVFAPPPSEKPKVGDKA